MNFSLFKLIDNIPGALFCISKEGKLSLDDSLKIVMVENVDLDVEFDKDNKLHLEENPELSFWTVQTSLKDPDYLRGWYEKVVKKHILNGNVIIPSEIKNEEEKKKLCNQLLTLKSKGEFPQLDVPELKEFFDELKQIG